MGDNASRDVVIGVMGPGEGCPDDVSALAYEVGRLIADRGWWVLTGGRAAGVMDAALRGAADAGGRTLAILPGTDKTVASRYARLVIPTGLGNARNAVNVLASDVVVACGMGPGTASEVALALKSGKPVVLMIAGGEESIRFFGTLAEPGLLHHAAAPEDLMPIVEHILTISAS